MPFDSPELLSQAGYDSGDFVPLLSFQAGQNDSTASNTFNIYAANRLEPRFQWDVQFPDDVQTQAAFSGEVDPSTDTIDMRVRNISDAETLVSEPNITGGVQAFSAGPVDYTPTTTTSPVQIIVQHRNEDNSTTVTTNDCVFTIGIQL